MMSISTDKKLELLRGIRLENQRNHQLMQERQHILEAPSFRETSMGNMDRGKGTSPGWRSLRFRIFVSFLLLVDLLLPTRWNGTIAALIAICSCNR